MGFLDKLFGTKPKSPQQQAIAEIKKMGGKIKRSPHMEVNLSRTDVTDAGLEYLKWLDNLRILHVNRTQVTDAGLKHLKGLTTLVILTLGHSKITDAGLKHLKDLRLLISLDLEGTQITDAGLMHLQGFIKLQTLDLGDTQVTEDSAKKLLQALPGCTIFPWQLEVDS